MKRFAIISWLTLLWYLLLGNVHAWEVPSYLRINSGSRMWFSELQGDLIQTDKTKLDLTQNLGIKKDKLVWEYFASARIENIHVIRLRAEASTLYEQSHNDSHLKVAAGFLGYDLDFYMTPQILLGANLEGALLYFETRVRDVKVGGTTFNYVTKDTQILPRFGVHATFYPILDGIALRPNIGGRFNWWSYNNLDTWEWEATGGVDVPINPLWTWSVSGGFRSFHFKSDRGRDTLDMNRTGFFLETSVLF